MSNRLYYLVSSDPRYGVVVSDFLKKSLPSVYINRPINFKDFKWKNQI